MQQPSKIWWARPRKLCALERPGGGGRSHRRKRREEEIDYLRARGVRLVISVMASRHNLADYDRAGLEWHHVPVPSTANGAAALEELLAILKKELKAKGAVAVHGNSHTDFAAALCAAHLHEVRDIDPAEALAAAGRAGLQITPEACALLGAKPLEA